MKLALCSFVLLFALSATAFVSAQTTTIDFNNEKVGEVPSSFSTALTGRGRPGKWVVMKDSASPDQGNVLAQTDADTTGYRFPVCVYDGLTAKDVDVSVKFKPISGKGDQASWLRTFTRIVLPQMRTGLAAAWVVAFIFAFGELGATVLVTPPGESTLPVRIYTMIANTPASTVAALALMQAGIVLVPLALFGILARNREVRA